MLSSVFWIVVWFVLNVHNIFLNDSYVISKMFDNYLFSLYYMGILNRISLTEFTKIKKIKKNWTWPKANILLMFCLFVQFCNLFTLKKINYVTVFKIIVVVWIIVWYDDRVNRKLNFLKFFTTIAYQVIQLILLYVVGMDVLSRRLLILKEAGMPEKKTSFHIHQLSITRIEFGLLR